MDLALGTVCEGKVTGITKFGAFVALPEGKSGMVHISEIAHSYVSDIRQHLTEGQMVKVKVISIDKEGRINLSIKKTVDPPVPSGRRPYVQQGGFERRTAQPAAPQSFEDKLKAFMQESESRQSDYRYSVDRRSSRRGRK